MLSVFPSLLSYGQLSPFLIRVTLGIVFMIFAIRELRNSQRRDSPSTNSGLAKVVAMIEFIAGILLILGVRTQVAALILTIDLVIRLVFKIRERSFLTNGVNYYLLLLVLAISLLMTGAGFYAFDLPL